MRLGRVKTAALNKVRSVGNDLVNVHPGITLESTGNTDLSLGLNVTYMQIYFFDLLTFPVRMTTLVSGS